MELRLSTLSQLIENALKWGNSSELASFVSSENLNVECLDFIIQNIGSRPHETLTSENESNTLQVIEGLIAAVNFDVQQLSYFAKYLLNYVIEDAVHIANIKKVVHILNTVLEDSRVVCAIIRDEALEGSIQILGRKLPLIGDFECQSLMFETLCRLANDNDKIKWASIWFSDDLVKSIFLSLDPQRFEMNCRKALNCINRSEDNKRVFSCIAYSVTFGCLQLREPPGCDFWIDFNHDTQSISFCCQELYDAQSELWETILINSGFVKEYKIKDDISSGTKTLFINLKCSCSTLLASSDSKVRGNVITIVFPSFLHFEHHIKRIYGSVDASLRKECEKLRKSRKKKNFKVSEVSDCIPLDTLIETGNFAKDSYKSKKLSISTNLIECEIETGNFAKDRYRSQRSSISSNLIECEIKKTDENNLEIRKVSDSSQSIKLQRRQDLDSDVICKYKRNEPSSSYSSTCKRKVSSSCLNLQNSTDCMEVCSIISLLRRDEKEKPRSSISSSYIKLSDIKSGLKNEKKYEQTSIGISNSGYVNTVEPSNHKSPNYESVFKEKERQSERNTSCKLKSNLINPNKRKNQSEVKVASEFQNVCCIFSEDSIKTDFSVGGAKPNNFKKELKMSTQFDGSYKKFQHSLPEGKTTKSVKRKFSEIENEGCQSSKESRNPTVLSLEETHSPESIKGIKNKNVKASENENETDAYSEKLNESPNSRNSMVEDKQSLNEIINTYNETGSKTRQKSVRLYNLDKAPIYDVPPDFSKKKISDAESNSQGKKSIGHVHKKILKEQKSADSKSSQINKTSSEISSHSDDYGCMNQIPIDGAENDGIILSKCKKSSKEGGKYLRTHKTELMTEEKSIKTYVKEDTSDEEQDFKEMTLSLKGSKTACKKNLDDWKTKGSFLKKETLRKPRRAAVKAREKNKALLDIFKSDTTYENDLSGVIKEQKTPVCEMVKRRKISKGGGASFTEDLLFDTETGSSEVSWFGRKKSFPLFETPKKSYSEWRKSKQNCIRPLPIKLELQNKNLPQLTKTAKKKYFSSCGKTKNTEVKLKSTSLSDFENYNLTVEKITNKANHPSVKRVESDFLSASDHTFKHMDVLEHVNSSQVGEIDKLLSITELKANMLYKTNKELCEDEIQYIHEDSRHKKAAVDFGTAYQKMSHHDEHEKGGLVNFNCTETSLNSNSKTVGKNFSTQCQESTEMPLDMPECDKTFLKASPSKSVNSTTKHGDFMQQNITAASEVSVSKPEDILSQKSLKSIENEQYGKQLHLARFLMSISPSPPSLNAVKGLDERKSLSDIFPKRKLKQLDHVCTTKKRQCRQATSVESDFASNKVKDIDAKNLYEEFSFNSYKNVGLELENSSNSSKSKKAHYSASTCIPNAETNFELQKRDSKNKSICSEHKAVSHTPHKELASSLKNHSPKKQKSFSSLDLSIVKAQEKLLQSIFCILSKETCSLTHRLLGTVQKWTYDYSTKLNMLRQNIVATSQVLRKYPNQKVSKGDIISILKYCRESRIEIRRSLQKILIVGQSYFEEEKLHNRKLKKKHKKATNLYERSVHEAKTKAIGTLNKKIMLKLKHFCRRFLDSVEAS